MLKIATVFADLRSVGEASDCYTLHCVQCVESVDVKKQQRVGLFMITSPPRAVAKYRDECVCMCVCVSLRLCLSVCRTGWAYLWNHTRDLYQFFVHVAHVRDSVLLRHVDDRPHRLSAGSG